MKLSGAARFAILFACLATGCAARFTVDSACYSRASLPAFPPGNSLEQLERLYSITSSTMVDLYNPSLLHHLHYTHPWLEQRQPDGRWQSANGPWEDATNSIVWEWYVPVVRPRKHRPWPAKLFRELAPGRYRFVTRTWWRKHEEHTLATQEFEIRDGDCPRAR